MYIGSIIIFMFLDSTDVQSVNATVVGKSTIDIQCRFIHESDALGCKVVLNSDCSNMHINLSRKITYASEQFTLTHDQILSCYHRVFAFDIDVNNTISNLSVEGKINQMTCSVCIEGKVYSPPPPNKLMFRVCIMTMIQCLIKRSFLSLFLYPQH